MQQDALNILFFIQPSRINKKGQSPIYCRITYQGSRKQFSTGKFIESLSWNAKKQLTASKAINSNLAIIRQQLDRHFLSLSVREESFTVQDIIDRYFYKETKHEETLIAYFEKYLIKQKKLIGIDLKQATWNKYHYVKEHTAQFINWKINQKDLPLSKLKHQFLVDFEYYLKIVLHQKQVTINKEIQRLRKPIKEACNEGLLDKDPFVKHKPKTVLKTVVFLDREELKKLEEHNFKQPRLNFVKDLFIFSCYTGLPYRELMNLRKGNILKGFDNNLWIEINREKTQKDLAIPLLPTSLEILQSYASREEYIFPRISNQKLNSYLKEIASILGIEKRLTHHTARKTFASTVLLYNNVTMEIVSELLGHSSINITEGYYGKVVRRKISQEINRIFFDSSE
ncbi:site-specific integrase [Robertkochia flava]|uniref:site-specific integrase n=1 Tax=Robertkochia flava TaxID=3447986 RepID=UPI001CCB6C2B|nr:site-specific integrase [Robertkochia marina]